MQDQRLIIIRGNSGSGKSAAAARLREILGGKVAILGQDTLRRTILKEKDSLENTDIFGLLEQTVSYCLDKQYTVIVEGIFTRKKYKDTLVRLMQNANCQSAVFYIDVSFEETLRRHKTKPEENDFGEEEMRRWYQPKDYLGVPGEVIISENSSLEETATLIREIIK